MEWAGSRPRGGERKERERVGRLGQNWLENEKRPRADIENTNPF
jgi:hypothetical protein